MDVCPESLQEKLFTKMFVDYFSYFVKGNMTF